MQGLDGCLCANDYLCSRLEVEKLCQVETGPRSDACEAAPGQDVTYIYRIFQGCPLGQGASDSVTVFDDQFGKDPIFSNVPISSADLIELTRTTRIFETTTNTATVFFEQSGGGPPECGGARTDALTVTVTGTPTPIQTPPPPTPLPSCTGPWPVTTVMTIGKGQSPSNNGKVMSYITGHIINPTSLGATAHRIPICSGTSVNVFVRDVTPGSPTPTVVAASAGITCSGNFCIIEAISEKEKYIARSSDGKDTDRITLLPE